MSGNKEAAHLKDGLLGEKHKSVAASGVLLNRKMRPSNEAVWGGNFEDPKGPKRGIRALRLRILDTLADRHTQF